MVDEDGYLTRAAMLAFYRDSEHRVTGAYMIHPSEVFFRHPDDNFKFLFRGNDIREGCSEFAIIPSALFEFSRKVRLYHFSDILSLTP